ncbi:MAG: hypothetical protein U1F63_14220 [Chitinivorax sp.]
MRIPSVPTSQRPPLKEIRTEGAVSADATRPVQPSPRSQVYRPVQALSGPAGEHWADRRKHDDRRKVCLLRRPLPWLFEFRQAGDRRRQNRRHDDDADHVDISV